MSDYHLAQLNIARMKFAFESVEMREFVDNLDRINAMADSAPGFVWRLQTDDGNATAVHYFGEDVLVNMSVWRDIDSLHRFVYRSAHNQVMASRKKWFDRIEPAYQVMWWIPSGHIPDVEEADQRLRYLRDNGPTSRAFDFKHRFDPE